MFQVYNLVISSNGLILVSPTHNYNITAWMNAFFDRLYCLYNFVNSVPRSWTSLLANLGRKAVIAAICEQEDEKDMDVTLEAMRGPLEALGYDIVGELPIFRIFHKGKVKEDEAALQQAQELGVKLAKSL